MLLYNVTISIDPEIEDSWLTWMREKHINDVMNTGCFLEARLCRVHGEEEGGLTYAVTYLCPSQKDFDTYSTELSKALQAEHLNKFSPRFAAFRTMLTVVEEFKK